ncbi:unnamed protein product [Rotaria magnacalcarata]|uniref:Uncharacterized protein n=2 Tax=Rotaria magnacalcarata TaxID=392030 RepID=A0A816U822_9BILA|nr:unnamed protein product [Rotaria magnacalcarata]
MVVGGNMIKNNSACAAIILPPVLTMVIFEKKKTSGTSRADLKASPCSNIATCIGSETQYPITSGAVLYPFDGNTRDAFLLPRYNCGACSGSAILLNATQQQYASIPFIDFRNTSFKLEVWVLPINAATNSGLQDDFPIFGHSTLIPYWNWIHAAVVYDITIYQQLIYFNGIIDTVSKGIVTPYQGSSSLASTTIGLGKSAAFAVTSFYGMIDQFLITPQTAKSSCQIYNDALLVAYFPFDTNGTLNDRSASVSPGSSSGTSITSGYIQEALLFSSVTNSFFQSACFPYFRRSLTFTLLLWVNPTTVSGGGTIVHVSSDQNGNGTLCFDMFGMTLNGTIIVQTVQNTLVFSNRNGMRFYVNGTLNNAQPNTVNTLAFWSLTSSQLYITLGNSQITGAAAPSCEKGTLPIVSGAFSGTIDEFRLYMTELNGEEICTLVNL